VHYGKQQNKPPTGHTNRYTLAGMVGTYLVFGFVTTVVLRFLRVPFADRIATTLDIALCLIFAEPALSWLADLVRGRKLQVGRLAQFSPLGLGAILALISAVPVVAFLSSFGSLDVGTILIVFAVSCFVGAMGERMVYATDGMTIREYYASKYVVSDAPTAKPSAATPAQTSGGLALRIGTTTGLLAERGHLTGGAAGQTIFLRPADAGKNALVLGGTGSGKTSCVVNPLTDQLFGSGAGVLVFDVKAEGDALALAKRRGRSVDVIGYGAGQVGLNLIEGMAINSVVAVFRDLFEMLGESGGFWVNSACLRLKCALTVLHAIPNHYDLGSLYSYFYDPEATETMLSELQFSVKTASVRRQRAVEYARHWETHVYDTLDERIKSAIVATLAQVLTDFSIDPDLRDAFCSGGGQQADLQRLLDGHAFVLSVPYAEKGDTARTVMHLVKRRYANMMQNRRLHPDWNQTRPIAFVCDEYQYVAAASDSSFLDKSRSSGAIFIAAAQSIAAFDQIVKSKVAVDAIIANMRQLIVFSVEDERTISRLRTIAGDVDRWQYSTSNSSRGDDQMTAGISWSERHSSLISGSLFRGLKQNQALAMLQIDGAGFDDVIDCTPLYLPQAANPPTTGTRSVAPRREVPIPKPNVGRYIENSPTRAASRPASSEGIETGRSS